MINIDILLAMDNPTLLNYHINKLEEELIRLNRPTDCPYTFDYQIERITKVEKLLKKLKE